jgi:hypothetical protein
MFSTSNIKERIKDATTLHADPKMHGIAKYDVFTSAYS